MLNNFLNLKEPIEIVITTSKAKVFNDKENIRLKEEDYKLLKDYKDIFEVFIKATKKLQGNKYPTIYHSLPLISQIFQNLELIKEKTIVSPYYFILINLLTNNIELKNKTSYR